jgi:uncharacterized membrane-anchored protein
MFGAIIGLVAFAHFVLKVNAVLTFWVAYILTRTLEASIGDHLSQAAMPVASLSAWSRPVRSSWPLSSPSSST